MRCISSAKHGIRESAAHARTSVLLWEVHVHIADSLGVEGGPLNIDELELQRATAALRGAARLNKNFLAPSGGVAANKSSRWSVLISLATSLAR